MFDSTFTKTILRCSKKIWITKNL